MVITTILEVAGLGLIFSIVGSLGDASTKSSLFIYKLSAFFELDKTEIFSSLLLIFIFFYLMKIIFLAFYNWFESNFLYSYRENLSSKLFQKYLNQDLIFIIRFFGIIISSSIFVSLFFNSKISSFL